MSFVVLKLTRKRPNIKITEARNAYLMRYRCVCVLGWLSFIKKKRKKASKNYQSFFVSIVIFFDHVIQRRPALTSLNVALVIPLRSSIVLCSSLGWVCVELRSRLHHLVSLVSFVDDIAAKEKKKWGFIPALTYPEMTVECSSWSPLIFFFL